MAFAKKKQEQQAIVIKPPKMVSLVLPILGTAPFMQLRFSQKAMAMMGGAMELDTAERRQQKKERKPRNFQEDFEQSQYRSTEGWPGIPAAAFRGALVRACSAVDGLSMVQGKMSIFVIADGIDAQDGTPLVRLYSDDDPELHKGLVRNATGVADIRVRAQWRNWLCRPRIEFDGDLITAESVANLLARAGWQIGVGEGRPFSKNSCGMGLGTFKLIDDELADKLLDEWSGKSVSKKKLA